MEKNQMRIYYAVEAIIQDDEFWEEIEITDNKEQAVKLYNEWANELPSFYDSFNLRIVSKKNITQYK
jgi:hypothetical protein